MTQNASRRLSFIACALLALAAAGCGSKPRMQLTQSAAQPLPGYRSFAILPMTEHTPDSESAAAPTVIGVIRAQLESKGYTETKPEQADFAIHVSASFLPLTKVETWGFAGLVPAEDGAAGTSVVVRALDSKTKRVIWSGEATAPIRKKKKQLPAAVRVENGCRAILKMFEGFPRAVTP